MGFHFHTSIACRQPKRVASVVGSLRERESSARFALFSSLNTAGPGSSSCHNTLHANRRSLAIHHLRESEREWEREWEWEWCVHIDML